MRTYSQNKKLFLKRIVIIICVLLTIAFSIKNLREPDLWWQIRTGEWILQNHAVPHTDCFSCTFYGTEWINIKWGFEVVAAIIARASGPESIFILQALVSCLLVFFLWKVTKVFRLLYFLKDPNPNEYLHLSFFISFIISIVAMEYRMNGRPEMMSHLFTIVFLFLLTSNRLKTSKQIYLLIPLQLLWANLHEAFGTGLVMIFTFAMAAWIEQWMVKRKILETKKQNPVQLSLLALCAAGVVLINPNGINLLTRPIHILSQVYQNKYTTELLSFLDHEYWQKEAYVALCIFIIVLCGLLIGNRQHARNRIGFLFEKFGLAYFILLAAFLYLSLIAYRNIIFMIILLFPVFVITVERVLQWISRKTEGKISFSSVYSVAAVFISGSVLYVLVISNTYYKWTNSRNRFGLEILSLDVPSGAASYISTHGLQKKKCFSDYLTSSYLLWKLQPDFKTFIDLRDLDIFPPEFFSRFTRARGSPQVFRELDSTYHFDYAVVYQPEYPALHRYLYNDSLFALTYVDAVAAVYEKTDTFTRSDIFSSSSPLPVSKFSLTFNRILNPFYSPFNYDHVNYDGIAASYYISVLHYDIAEQRALRILENKDERYKGMELLGEVYLNKSMHEPDSSRKVQLQEAALEKFIRSQQMYPEFAPAYTGAGLIYFQQKKFKTAADHFEKSLRYDGNNSKTLSACANSYLALSEKSDSHSTDFLGKALSCFLHAEELTGGDAMIELNIGLVAFRLHDKNFSKEYLHKAIDSGLLNQADQQRANQCLQSME
ncbi:MAG: hypothetical protein NT126_11450 [Bacteroidetes bacterium]|nr:hypothetical protein [Bacteroidota bacterium]